MNILIVDNNRAQVQDLIDILIDNEYECHYCSYEDMERLTTDNKFDLIIMDIMNDTLHPDYGIEQLPRLGCYLARDILEPKGLRYIFYSLLLEIPMLPDVELKPSFFKGFFSKRATLPSEMVQIVNKLIR